MKYFILILISVFITVVQSGCAWRGWGVIMTTNVNFLTIANWTNISIVHAFTIHQMEKKTIFWSQIRAIMQHLQGQWKSEWSAPSGSNRLPAPECLLLRIIYYMFGVYSNVWYRNILFGIAGRSIVFEKIRTHWRKHYCVIHRFAYWVRF